MTIDPFLNRRRPGKLHTNAPSTERKWMNPFQADSLQLFQLKAHKIRLSISRLHPSTGQQNFGLTLNSRTLNSKLSNFPLLAASALALAILTPTYLPAQDFDGLPVKSRQYVTFLSADTTLPATKRTTLTLHFHVVDGYHVNSHKPFSDLQIPTNLTLQPSAGIKTTPADFPPGTTFTFAFDPNEKLSVYQGDFLVQIPITATPGPHQLLGALHYQACDDKACYPPKSLPLTLTFTAK